MPDPTPRYFRLVVYEDDGTTPRLTVTSLPPWVDPAGGYIEAPPAVTGATFDPVTGETVAAQASVRLLDPADATTGERLVTSKLTDGGFRYDLLGRSAAVAYTDTAALAGPWTPYVVGAVTRCAMAAATAWDVVVSEDATAEQTAELFRAPTTEFPLITSLIGGPVRGSGDLPALPDKGGWRYRLTSLSGDVAYLNFVAAWVNHGPTGPTWEPVPGAPSRYPGWRLQRYVPEAIDWDHVEGALSPDDDNAVNQLAAPFFVAESTYHMTGDNIRGSYRGGLVARLERYDTLAHVGDFVPLAQPAKFVSGRGVLFMELVRGGDLAVEWPAGVAASERVVGREFSVYVTPLIATSEFPAFALGHPVTIVADSYRAAGRSVDAASEAATVAALGPDLSVLLDFGEGATPAEVAAPMFGLFGFSRRATAAGAVEFFPTRGARDAAAPGATLTLAELHPDAMSVPIFDLSADGVVNRVIVSQRGYPVLEIDPSDPAEAAASRKRFGVRSVSYTLPGQVLADGGGRSYFDAAAAETFDRALRGQPSGAVVCVDTPAVAAIREGDEIVLALPHGVDPTTAPASRGGSGRVCVVVERTPSPERGTITFQLRELGQAAQVPTAPTLSIAQSTDDARHVAVVTITNAAALAAAGLLVRLEWVTGAGAPAGNGALLAVVDPASITTVRTPVVSAAGQTVQARAQSTTRDGRRPSAFSAWASVALAGLTAPSALTATADAADGSRLDLAWTNGASDLPVEVQARVTATEPALKTLALLPAGSVQHTLTGLVASTGYTVSVRHRESAPYDGVSASVSDTETTSGTVPTLTAPPAPLISSNGAGTVRIDAISAEGPDTLLACELADETAVGSGTAGAFSLLERKASDPSDYVTFTRGVIANTGKRVYARVRHERSGATASAYSPEVSADPWAVSSGGGGPLPTVPAPTIGASRAGGLVTITGTPGAGTPSGTVFVAEDSPTGAGTYAENSGASSTTFPFDGLMAAGSDVRVRADRAGYLSSYSNVVVNV